MGMRNLLVLFYAPMAVWIPHLIYFWFSVLSLCIAPFLFNPHQFSYADFIIDYREFLRWMSGGNSRSKASRWYGYCRLSTDIYGILSCLASQGTDNLYHTPGSRSASLSDRGFSFIAFRDDVLRWHPFKRNCCRAHFHRSKQNDHGRFKT